MYYIVLCIMTRIDGTHLSELLPSILLSGSEGIGKYMVVETLARRLFMHVYQVICSIFTHHVP